MAASSPLGEGNVVASQQLFLLGVGATSLSVLIGIVAVVAALRRPTKTATIELHPQTAGGEDDDSDGDRKVLIAMHHQNAAAATTTTTTEEEEGTSGSESNSDDSSRGLLSRRQQRQ